jgi:Putative MetA-pathway of phenol degradation
MKLTAISLLAAATSIAAAPAFAEDAPVLAEEAPVYQGLSLSTGADYSSGAYGGAAKTNIFVAPLSITEKTGAWRFSASIPYLRISGPGNVVIGADGRPLPGVPGVAGTRSGFGDLSLAATASLPPDALGGFSVDLTGRVKLPTSKSSEHLGTGKTDFSMNADISYPMGNWAPFVDIGYRIPGRPSGIDLKNAVTASVGTSYAMGHTVLIASYDYSQASSPLAKDAQEIFGAVSTPIARRVNATLYGIGGLSDGSPDYEAGLLFTVKLN